MIEGFNAYPKILGIKSRELLKFLLILPTKTYSFNEEHKPKWMKKGQRDILKLKKEKKIINRKNTNFTTILIWKAVFRILFGVCVFLSEIIIWFLILVRMSFFDFSFSCHHCAQKTLVIFEAKYYLWVKIFSCPRWCRIV